MTRTIRTLYNTLARTRGARFLSLGIAYAILMTLALWVSYLLRFDFRVPPSFGRALAQSLWWLLLLKLTALVAFGQFEDSLSYFSTPDLKRLFGVGVVSSATIMLVYKAWGVAIAPPRGVILIDLQVSVSILCAGRLALRFLREQVLAPHTRPSRLARRVGIIGAGDTGAALVREAFAKRWLGVRPIAFFDDYRGEHSRVHGIPVWGPPERLLDPKMGMRLDEVVIAIPSASGSRFREIVKILQEAHMPFRTVPSMAQLATGKVSVSSLRPVNIDDLLGREVVRIETNNIRDMIEGRAVLVTGAGGSIGSELCRQIATFNPRTLLLVERSEAALFPIEQELAGQGLVTVPLVADIMDARRMENIFSRFRPHAVFHAAAHKHVPMMESQPAEAIRNNIFGTARVAELAYQYNAERFLLVSTDKAINPTSVMGATKRMAEIFVQAMQTRDRATMKFTAVRFGNVLGSSGSVAPIFTRQIAAGGPVKVTHPDVTRYFMTIPEAVSLVLQSAARAEGGEIFVLDMGKPVKILDLAKQMIELSGLKPHKDIAIEFTGLRPGEKLYEELSHSEESVTTTHHPKIRRLVCDPLPYFSAQAIVNELAESLLIERTNPDETKLLLKKIIPEYVPEMKVPLWDGAMAKSGVVEAAVPAA